MSNCETKGWDTCGCCGGSVAVKTNRSGLAYYRCDHCGVHVQHHWQKTSAKLLQKFGPTAPDVADQKPAAAPKVEKKPAPSVASLLGLGG